MGKQQFEELKQAAAPWPGPRLHVPREEAASGSGQQVEIREREVGVCAAVHCSENRVLEMCQLLGPPKEDAGCGMRDAGHHSSSPSAACGQKARVPQDCRVFRDLLLSF